MCLPIICFVCLFVFLFCCLLLQSFLILDVISYIWSNMHDLMSSVFLSMFFDLFKSITHANLFLTIAISFMSKAIKEESSLD